MDEFTWTRQVAVALLLLKTMADHPDMDKAYYKGMVDGLVATMPESLAVYIDQWLGSAPGIEFMEDIKFNSMVNPYDPTGKYKDNLPFGDKRKSGPAKPGRTEDLS